ncbi:hypothetical protein P9873_02180 [Bacillus siamensis]|uniref:DUF7003 family protein n=1 Tax=Bacillus siamensis TaxID=659243 RepID=UPI0006459FDF|nr:hypothetical protein [Bacillus siamensis]MED5046811.1 hypothetical protein [Bacillus siamensis]
MLGGKKEAILALLNDSFNKKEFPFLDNENFDFAKGKLSIFIERDNWLLTFQLFGLSRLGPAIDFYAVGNQLTNNEVSFLDDEPFLFADEKGNLLELEDIESGFTSKQINVSLREKTFQFFIEQEIKDKISPKNEWITCLRHMTKNRLFLDTLWLTKQEQLEIAGLSSEYEQLYSTELWMHPEGEKDLPSLSPFFQSIAEAISRQEIAYIQKHDDGNTEWPKWAHTDSVQYF